MTEEFENVEKGNRAEIWEQRLSFVKEIIEADTVFSWPGITASAEQGLYDAAEEFPELIDDPAELLSLFEKQGLKLHLNPRNPGAKTIIALPADVDLLREDINDFLLPLTDLVTSADMEEDLSNLLKMTREALKT
jgi:hypothetical protein